MTTRPGSRLPWQTVAAVALIGLAAGLIVAEIVVLAARAGGDEWSARTHVVHAAPLDAEALRAVDVLLTSRVVAEGVADELNIWDRPIVEDTTWRQIDEVTVLIDHRGDDRAQAVSVAETIGNEYARWVDGAQATPATAQPIPSGNGVTPAVVLGLATAVTVTAVGTVAATRRRAAGA